ncbi:chitin binding peritrophin-A domain-containing protein [Streptomyces sp. G1]|uniref:chitin binding peritrophin-A domain-containing protein n=1 Tax=Streptomyces sp. G1 TaxID=361572 RepID=UPI002030CED2|nr:chitin binding peritrophin-A domain-containing protein [Streptomyces sp. G1]MCM1972945.1 chitin binding domain-containing protein [Streptomyces sp. G1]
MKIRRVLASLALVAPLLAAVPTAAAAVSPPPANRDIRKRPGGYYQHKQDGRYFYQCDNAYRPYRHRCPDGMLFNEEARPGPVCDWPDQVYTHGPRPAVTALRAEPALYDPDKRQVTGLTAVMKQGLIGEKITFTTMTGVVLCTATTDKPGGINAPGPDTISTASCNSKTGLTIPAGTVLRGYKAVYAEDSELAHPDHATGTIKRKS